jgi:hypothetical protein
MKSKILFLIALFLYGIACVNTTQDEILKDPEINAVMLNYSQVNKTLFIAAEIIDPQGPNNIATVPFTLYRRDSVNATNETIFDEDFLINNGGGGDIINGDHVWSRLINPDTLAGNEGYFRVTVQAFDVDGNSSTIEEQATLVAPNSPPEIFPIEIPTSFEKGDLVRFEVRVSDPQGAGDIVSVAFTVARPDGSYAPDSYPLSDKGPNDSYHGDTIANDGIYTTTLLTDANSTRQGLFTFYFVAEDIHGASSEILEATMTNPGVHLLSPDTTETLDPYEYYTITWESAYINKVALAYTINANASSPNYETIDTVYAATKSYEWAVPYPLGDATYCKVRISDAAHSSRSDESDETFRIIP